MTTNEKNCYCHTCKKYYHYLGITRHKAMHRDNQENCTITFTHGDTWKFNYEERKNEEKN